jgi:starch phosphorylase
MTQTQKNSQICPPANPSDQVADLKASILHQLRLTLARQLENVSKQELWTAVCLAVREQIMEKYIRTQKTHLEKDVRRVHYLSLEYLMGRLLESNLCNLGIRESLGDALAEMGFDLSELLNEEHDMGLGNGGLGRLAACFLDSMATMDLPAIGYGIHYQYGLFKQEFEKGRQVEKPDDWRRFGNPWEIARPQFMQKVQLYGHVQHDYDDLGDYRPIQLIFSAFGSRRHRKSLTSMYSIRAAM